MTRFSRLFSLFSLLALVPIASAVQTKPPYIVYEGQLLSDAGTPITTGSYTFRFSIWNDGDAVPSDTAGGAIDTGTPRYLGWTEVQTKPIGAHGHFNYILGEVTPFDPLLLEVPPRYLQVEVKKASQPDTSYELMNYDPSNALADRMPIVSVPYALNSDKIDWREPGTSPGDIAYINETTGYIDASVIPAVTPAPHPVHDVMQVRYPHMHFDADGSNNVGSMYEETHVRGGAEKPALRWATRSGTAQDYDVVVVYTLPDTFVDMTTLSPPLQIEYQTTGNAVLSATMLLNGSGVDLLAGAGASMTSGGSWTTQSFSLPTAGGFTAGDTLTLRIRMTTDALSSALLGDITVTSTQY